MWTRTRVPGSTSIAIAMRRRRTTARLHQGDLQHQAPALGASYVPPNEFEKSFAEHAAWFQRPQRSKPRGFTPVTCLKVLLKHRSRSIRSLDARMRRVGANICGQSQPAGLQLRSKGVRGVVGPARSRIACAPWTAGVPDQWRDPRLGLYNGHGPRQYRRAHRFHGAGPQARRRLGFD